MAKDTSILGYFYIIVGLVLFIFGAGGLIFRFLLGFLGLYLIDYGFRTNGLPPLLYQITRLINIILYKG